MLDKNRKLQKKKKTKIVEVVSKLTHINSDNNNNNKSNNKNTPLEMYGVPATCAHLVFTLVQCATRVHSHPVSSSRFGSN